MAFLLTCDRLKEVTRTTFLHSGARAENSAEHSWHLALMALTLGQYAPSGTRIERVVQLLLVHDLVESGAGDTHSGASAETLAAQAQGVAQAARELFGTLPPAQAAQVQALRQEFEARTTPEARFARALDALQPMLLTWGAGGLGCAARHPELSAARLLALKEPHLREFPALWSYAQGLVRDAEDAGLFAV